MGERTSLETKKNNLEHALTNNLLKTKAELHRELEDISTSDKKQQLEMTATELTHLDATITQNQEKYGGRCVFSNFCGCGFSAQKAMNLIHCRERASPDCNCCVIACVVWGRSSWQSYSML